MLSPDEQRPTAVEGAHLVLYDGVCGLCNGLVQFVLAHDRHGLFHFSSLQSETARVVLAPFGSSPDDLATLYVLVNYRGAAPVQLTRSRAVLFVMAALGWPWKAMGLLAVLPSPILDRLYDVIARNRYRMFGRHERCLLPRQEYRRRFIDSQSDARPD
jgi:predicted DCC family thiol-disulfide oxidoreductase YuxK